MIRIRRFMNSFESTEFLLNLETFFPVDSKKNSSDILNKEYSWVMFVRC